VPLHKEIEITNEFAVDDIPVKQHVLKKAQYGDGLAICRIGRIYYDRKEYTKAIDWFRLGVVKGLANAQFLVGLMRHQGEGVTKDYGLALKWFLEGAKKADGFCQYSIGLYYEYGYGVDIDKQFALKYFEKSAQQGYKYTKEEIKYLNEQGYFIDDEQKSK
jgi:TPR repeat protein